MDESTTTAVAEPTSQVATTPVTEGSTPEPQQPDASSTDNGNDSTPQPTDPAPQTTDPDVPDHGIDPDKGIDPGAGDEPVKQSTEDAQPDLSKMTRKERAEYFSDVTRDQRKKVEQAVDSVYKPQPLDELKQSYLNETDEYGNPKYDDFQATVLAREQVREQQAQINEARAEIAELNAGLTIEAVEVVNTIPWLNTSNKDSYDQESTEAASQLYEQLAISKDPRTGQIVEARISPMQFYGLIDKIRSSGSSEAGIKAQKAAEQQMAAVAAPSSTSQTRETPFESMSLDQQRDYLTKKGHYVT